PATARMAPASYLPACRRARRATGREGENQALCSWDIRSHRPPRSRLRKPRRSCQRLFALSSNNSSNFRGAMTASAAPPNPGAEGRTSCLTAAPSEWDNPAAEHGARGHTGPQNHEGEIGRASCRERVEISVGEVAI